MLHIVLWLSSVVFLIYFFKKPSNVFNLIMFYVYFISYIIAIFGIITIWPFPIFNGKSVENGKLWSKLLKYVSYLCGITWELRNGEVLAKDRGAVIVANHQSMLDMIGLFHIWEIADKMTVVAKKALMYAGPLGVACYFSKVVFVDRKNPKDAYKQLEVTANIMKEKIKIMVYPEGTRNYDVTKFLQFKKGAFIMAVSAQAPIVPIIYSPYYFIDRNNYTFSKGRMIVQCLDEVSTEGLTMDDIPELIERVRNMMLAAYKDLTNEVMPSSTNDDNKGKDILY